MEQQTNRRDFLKDTTLAGVGFWAAGGVALAESKSANEKLNFACIGVGGKGDSDSSHVSRLGNVVAICDIDDNTLNKKANGKDRRTGEQPFLKAKKYNDFRKMFDEMAKEIDAVTVSTPDHCHAIASITAMKLGKHVYCQKPLTHSVYEARQMRETAERHKVATQMGNQGTAGDGLRRGVEIIRAGAIGPVHEVHVWTNRPIWPQGTDAIMQVSSARTAALAALHGKTPINVQGLAVPSHVHWDLFLGPAPVRPYDPIYHPFSWRGWWDFGTGALGDMACHTANLPFMALKLAYPTSIQAESGAINPETYPTWARITFQFPAREELPPVKLVWYEGHNERGRVLPPERLTKGQRVSDSGSLMVGEKGILFSPNDYGQRYTLLPEKDFQGYKAPPETLPRNKNGKRDIDFGQKEEWVAAIRGGRPALSNFGYAAMLTEAILLGDVAMRVGKRLEWDGPNMRVTNHPEAEQYIKPHFRQGWTL